MKLVCEEHGEVDRVSINGYGLGHHTPRNGPNELDLEGITFTFEVLSLPDRLDDPLELALIDADGAEDYLSKFADWEEIITRTAETYDEFDCGESDCHYMLWVLEDDETIPEK